VGCPSWPTTSSPARHGFNAVYQEAGPHGAPAWSTWDIFDLFSDENGEYSAYLHSSVGDLLDMRMPDGAHFTGTGPKPSLLVRPHHDPDEWGFTDRL